MLSKSFLDELFEPREMYTKSGLRQHFEQIAHSSVMRLNDASLIKLFDLMIMAVKYQFLLCKEPSELVLVTMNHLDGMKAIFKDHPTIIERIDHASTLLMDHFGDTPLWQMAVIRSELLNFLSGTCVKASPLLRAQRQLDGRE
uniref:NR LBD domain-containing protein n=1 Tax=Globodera pallida TaxID=36090 RepID=A0A183BTG9_GLOPA